MSEKDRADIENNGDDSDESKNPETGGHNMSPEDNDKEAGSERSFPLNKGIDNQNQHSSDKDGSHSSGDLMNNSSDDREDDHSKEAGSENSFTLNKGIDNQNQHSSDKDGSHSSGDLMKNSSDDREDDHSKEAGSERSFPLNKGIDNQNQHSSDKDESHSSGDLMKNSSDDREDNCKKDREDDHSDELKDDSSSDSSDHETLNQESFPFNSEDYPQTDEEREALNQSMWIFAVLFYGGILGLALLIASIFKVESIWHIEPLIEELSGWQGLILAVIIGLLVHAISTFTRTRFGWTQDFYDEIRKLIGKPSMESTTVLSTISSLAEEIFFRGVLLPLIGIIPQAIIFGLAHTGPGRSFRFWPFYAAFMGIVLGLLYQVTGNLLAPILAHFTINFFGLSSIEENKPS